MQVIRFTVMDSIIGGYGTKVMHAMVPYRLVHLLHAPRDIVNY